MAAVVYLDVDQGSDFSTDVTLQNNNGTPMDLTGFSAAAQFRKHPTSTTSYSFTIAIPEPSTGVIKLSLSAATSSTIKPGRYWFDLEITAAGNTSKTRVIEGMLTINAEITR